MSNVKMYICCHKDYDNVGITNPCYRVISDKDIKNNTSLKFVKSDGELDNRLWSELTQIYHVWKHPKLQADWIGFCHYRRYFDFMNDIPEFTKPVVAESMKQMMNNYANYDLCHNSMDMMSTLRIIREQQKDYFPYTLRMLDLHYFLPYNMFVLPKDLFNEMCEFIFGVLLAFDEKIKVNNSYEEMLKHIADYRERYVEKSMSPNNTYEYQARLYGFLSERLFTTFFVKYMHDNGKDSIEETKVLVTEKTYNRTDEKLIDEDDEKEKDQ
jgi:hypothetical protein